MLSGLTCDPECCICGLLGSERVAGSKFIPHANSQTHTDSIGQLGGHMIAIM